MATPANRLIAALVNRLEAALPALLAAEGLPAVSEVLDHDPALPQPAKAPQVWVDLSEQSRSADPHRGATLGAYSQVQRVLVGVTSAGSDPSSAAGNLRAMADLAAQCLEGDQSLGGETTWVKWLRTDLSPSFKQGTLLFKEAVLTFDLNRRVTRGTG